MEIAVISDLHLGRGDPADRFRHDDGSFLRFLDRLERGFERIVLLGDIWETLGSRHPGDARAELARARDAHPEIARRFQRPKYTYVHGNHDVIAKRVEKAPTEVVVRTDDVRILFTHGHQADWLEQHLNKVAELGAWVGSRLLELGQERLFRLFDRWHSALHQHAIDPGRCAFRRWAMGLAATREIDVMVTAHTHKGACEEHGVRLFMNSGTCAYGKYGYLSLDTGSGRYAFHREAA